MNRERRAALILLVMLAPPRTFARSSALPLFARAPDPFPEFPPEGDPPMPDLPPGRDPDPMPDVPPGPDPAPDPSFA